MIDVNRIMLYTLNLYSAVCQLYLIKTRILKKRVLNITTNSNGILVKIELEKAKKDPIINYQEAFELYK